jgi:hypothetical protein
MKTITETQRNLARHALGFPNKKNTSFRNRFCIGKGGDGYEDWEDLVSKGLAIKCVGADHGRPWGDSDMFYLTLEGALMVRGPKEHISREDAADMRRREA